MKVLHWVFAALLGIGLVACQQKAPEPSGAPPATNVAPRTISGSTNVQFYLVRGVVKKVDPAENTVTVQHEEIPNYMAAMTMPFKVKDAHELDGLVPGDTIWFGLWVAPDESWIGKIRKQNPEPPSAGSEPTNAPQASAPAEREPFRLARDVEPLSVGDPMPDYQFTNELGRTVRLSDFKGQALAFTFIFTRCPLPDFCPRMSRNFSEAYQKLTTNPNAPTNWHLLTISFDPHFDTPAVLRAYARMYQYDPKRWNFVTGAMIDIDAITDQFNLIILKRGNEWDHKVRTVVVDAAGRIQDIIYGNEWKPDALVQKIIKAAQAKQLAAAGPPGN